MLREACATCDIITSILMLFVFSAKADKIMGHLLAAEFVFAAGANDKRESQQKGSHFDNRWSRSPHKFCFQCWIVESLRRRKVAIAGNFTLEFGPTDSDIPMAIFSFFVFERAFTYLSFSWVSMWVWYVDSVSFLCDHDRVVDLFLIAALVVANNFYF